MTDHELPTRETGDTARRVALLTSVDQLLSSVSNALLLFTVAQTASVSEFGIAALMVAIIAGWMAFNRGALGAPILLVSNLESKDVRIESGYAMTWAAAVGVVAAVTVGAVGMIAGQPEVGVPFAVAVPAVLIQDVLRFAAIACEKPLLAVLSDGLWTILIGMVFLANIVGAAIPARYAVASWGASGLVAAFFLALATGVRPKIHRIGEWWRTYSRARIHFGFGDALSPVYTLAVLFAVTLIVDSAVAGTLRGATTLFGPIALLFSALPLVFVPHARRSSTSSSQQWRMLVKMSWVSSGLTAVATAAAVAVPASWGAAVMGSTWGVAVAVMPYEGLAVVAAIWMASVYVFLKLQGRSRAAFWTRLLQIVAQFTGTVVAAFAVGTAVAIAASGAALCWVVVAASVVLARQVATRSDDIGADDPRSLADDLVEQSDDEAVPSLRDEPRSQPAAAPRNGRQPWPVIDVLERGTSEVGRSG